MYLLACMYFKFVLWKETICCLKQKKTKVSVGSHSLFTVGDIFVGDQHVWRVFLRICKHGRKRMGKLLWFFLWMDKMWRLFWVRGRGEKRVGGKDVRRGNKWVKFIYSKAIADGITVWDCFLLCRKVHMWWLTREIAWPWETYLCKIREYIVSCFQSPPPLEDQQAYKQNKYSTLLRMLILKILILSPFSWQFLLNEYFL